jgi:hypothetical protein
MPPLRLVLPGQAAALHSQTNLFYVGRSKVLSCRASRYGCAPTARLLGRIRALSSEHVH